MVRKVANKAPKSAQVEAKLGSRIVFDPPKSAQEATPKTTPKKQPQHKPVWARNGKRASIVNNANNTNNMNNNINNNNQNIQKLM